MLSEWNTSLGINGIWCRKAGTTAFSVCLSFCLSLYLSVCLQAWHTSKIFTRNILNVASFLHRICDGISTHLKRAWITQYTIVSSDYKCAIYRFDWMIIIVQVWRDGKRELWRGNLQPVDVAKQGPCSEGHRRSHIAQQVRRERHHCSLYGHANYFDITD